MRRDIGTHPKGDPFDNYYKCPWPQELLSKALIATIVIRGRF
jgi:hypothetical protein